MQKAENAIEERKTKILGGEGMGLNKKVAKNIIKAQVASDSAKAIYELSYDGNIETNYFGKDRYILIAIDTIIRKKNTGFSFYVTRDYDMCGEPYLVYFTFKLGTEWYQVSFHSYGRSLAKYYSRGKHRVHWDRKSSRETCELLQEVMRMGA